MRQNKSKQIKEVIMNLSPAYEKWRQETLAEGEARGEARGEAQGQKYASISIARSMLQEGLPIDLIIKVTGLASTEIAQLRS
jgi:predicted transposase YdaD